MIQAVGDNASTCLSPKPKALWAARLTWLLSAPGQGGHPSCRAVRPSETPFSALTTLSSYG